MENVLMISDLAWVKRGVPKAVPERVKLNAEQLRTLLQEGGDVAEEGNEDSDEAMDEGDHPQQRSEEGAQHVHTNPSQNNENAEESETDDPEVNTRNAMAGIAQYSSPRDDPYITQQVDSDDEDKEDFEVKPDDNLLVVAKIDRGSFSLEVYLYNEGDDSFYVHHDYILDAPPLCIEGITYDPGADNGKGNLLAVGTMESVVNIWDLNLVNAVAPAVVLGKKLKGRRQRRDGSAQGHSDAVLSLSWNQNLDHILASGSADKTVVLWDLEEANPSTVLSHLTGQIQSLEWHPDESSLLLSGTLSGRVAIDDCRLNEGASNRQWTIDAEVERILWDRYNPFCFFVTADNGKLYYADSRTNSFLHERVAHEGGVRGISQSAFVKGLVTTCGADELLKVWKLSEDGLEEVHSQGMNMGGLHSLRFSPDSGCLVAVGGEKGDLVRLYSLKNINSVGRAFENFLH